MTTLLAGTAASSRITGPAFSRNTALDGLRGWAAAAVVVYHAILSGTATMVSDVLTPSILAQHNPYDWALKLTLSLLNGEAAVALFFVMSGLVLFRQLASMDRLHPSRVGLSWRFLLRRLLRLWPTMAICLISITLAIQMLHALAPGRVGLITFSDLGWNLILADTAVNRVTWTLAVELAGAPFLLLAYLGVRRWGMWRALPMLALGLGLLRATGVLKWLPGMLFGLPALLAGLILEGGLLFVLRPLALWRAALPAGAAIIVLDEVLISMDRAKHHGLILLIGATLVVGAIASADRGLVHRLLQTRVSQFLGRISFSLYLWSALPLFILFGFFRSSGAEARPLESGLALGVVAVLATIPLACLSEIWTERPFIRLGRALARAPEPRTADHR